MKKNFEDGNSPASRPNYDWRAPARHLCILSGYLLSMDPPDLYSSSQNTSLGKQLGDTKP